LSIGDDWWDSYLVPPYALEREIAKLWSPGKGVDAVMAAVSGAEIGAWIASRFLPTETHGDELRLPCNARRGVTIIVNALARVGRLQDGSNIDCVNPIFVIATRSGFLNLNPCIVAVEIVPKTDKETTAIIRGGAKEGLIKQRTAEKAVRRVIEAIRAEESRSSEPMNSSGQ
jgi:hypothetical protein